MEGDNRVIGGSPSIQLKIHWRHAASWMGDYETDIQHCWKVHHKDEPAGRHMLSDPEPSMLNLICGCANQQGLTTKMLYTGRT